MPYTKKPKTAPRRKYARKPKSKMTFEKRVMNVVHKQAETKQKVIQLYNGTNLQGSGLNPAPGSANQGLQTDNILSSMTIAQGLEQEQRQGNEISNCKLRVRGIIESLPYDSTTNPNSYGYEVHMVIFKKKDDPTGNNAFLKTAPGNLTVPCDGTLINTMYPYNKDLYTIKKVKTFRLQSFFTNAGLTATAQPNTYIFKRFYCDIPIAKKLKYNDSLTDPTNDWCSIAFYVVNADGSVITSQIRSQLTMDAVLTYDDF